MKQNDRGDSVKFPVLCIFKYHEPFEIQVKITILKPAVIIFRKLPWDYLCMLRKQFFEDIQILHS